MKNKFQFGFTLVEVIIVIGVSVLLSAIVLTSFMSLRKTQALTKDTELIVSVLRQARSQTLSSKNASTYGVHFTPSLVTLFTGSAYDSNSPSNQNFTLLGSDTVVTTSLVGGGSDVIFKRLTGETTQSGTITVSSTGTSMTKTVTIYKTGTVESD